MSQFGNSRRREKLTVYLNVYDMAQFNDLTYGVGLGVFHTGVEIGEKEYTFGGHDFDSTGVFNMPPREIPDTPGVTFRESLVMGEIDMTVQDVDRIVNAMKPDWPGNEYNILQRNCNHFSNALCERLLEKSIPNWVNRMAWFGETAQCLIPQSIQEQMGLATPSDPETSGSGSSSTSVFSGTGQTLSGTTISTTQDEATSEGSSWWSSSSETNDADESQSSQSQSQETDEERREKIRKAALKRFGEE
eukprot:TRINITY_DN5252_c0_g1_i1.p1 TRINITY_DN5252_c0_g1~~TRINITY_DN5252_c0_g1_i1.p1  ORF type:complete len:247 (+),score=66.63 TRINITY_DN5252_c0_g1_i1:213-953(+)